MIVITSYEEKRSVGAERVDSIKLMVEEDLTAIKALYPGYTEVLEHYVVLYKPPVTASEIEDMKTALTRLGAKKTTTWTDAAQLLGPVIIKDPLTTKEIPQ